MAGKDYLKYLNEELDYAIKEFLSSPDHKLHGFLYQDLKTFLLPDRHNGHYLEINNFYPFVKWPRKIENLNIFESSIKMVLETNIGLFVLNGTIIGRRINEKQIDLCIATYEIDALISNL